MLSIVNLLEMSRIERGVKEYHNDKGGSLTPDNRFSSRAAKTHPRVDVRKGSMSRLAFNLKTAGSNALKDGRKTLAQGMFKGARNLQTRAAAM